MSATTDPPLPPPGPDGVSLREITRDNLRAVLDLAVLPEQTKFVASNARSLAQAHFYQETAWYRAVYAGDLPVGFAMVSIDKPKREYFLWRFMLDHRYQRRGYGKRAIELLIDHVRTLPEATALLLSYVPGEGCPGPFYAQLGFVETGEIDDGELVMKLSFD